MKLHEFQSKALFAERGIPIPRGGVASSAEAARQIAAGLDGRVAVKAQVLVGGRGKAGGIKLASNSDEAFEYARDILGMHIKGLPVRKVLLDAAADPQSEIYLGVTNDRAARRAVLIASAAGGVDIEEVAATTPEKIARAHIDPFLGLKDYQSRSLAWAIDLPRKHWSAFGVIARALYDTFVEVDATLAEINPLVIDGDETLLALDGKIVLDDNALFRHDELAQMRDRDAETAAEAAAREAGLSYVALDGNIGCMVNGAGLAMGTMDIIKYHGGEPANFLDIGGGAGADKVAAALRIILSDGKVKALLVNIFGGITRCDEVAKGILDALDEVDLGAPLIVRLVGTNEEEGRKLLADADMITASSLGDAAQKAVAAAHV